MRGIATIERPSIDGTFAVWITNRTSLFEATHTNAVVVRPDDPQATDKALWLTRSCAVLVTDGSAVEDMRLAGDPLVRSDIDELLQEIEHHQHRGCQMVCVNGRVRRRAGCACSWKETYPDVRSEADLEVQDHAGA